MTIRLLDCMSLAHRISSGQAKIICVSTKSEPHGQKWRMYNKKRKSKNSFNITCSKNRLCISLSLSTKSHYVLRTKVGNIWFLNPLVLSK